jgi:iron complex transport system permease protein
MSRRRRARIGLVALAGAALLICLLRLLVDRDLTGGVGLAWPAPRLAWVRWTALAAGAICGAALGLSGMLLQALLRNPLASPFILGISGGAGLGVMVSLYVAHLAGAAAPGGATNMLPSLAGALAVLAVVYGLSQRRGWVDPVSLILIGVIVSSMCGALILLLHHLVPQGLHPEITRWMMGHIPEGTPAAPLAWAGGATVAGILISLHMGRAMDAATLGDDEARSVGLEVRPLRIVMFVVAGGLAAASVALCGPIGFVGLVGPHAARLVMGPRHTPLVLGSAFAGVILVVGADAGRQAIDLGAGRMPVGVFTALVGGPAFIWLLLRGRGQA